MVDESLLSHHPGRRWASGRCKNDFADPRSHPEPMNALCISCTRVLAASIGSLSSSRRDGSPITSVDLYWDELEMGLSFKRITSNSLHDESAVRSLSPDNWLNDRSIERSNRFRCKDAISLICASDTCRCSRLGIHPVNLSFFNGFPDSQSSRSKGKCITAGSVGSSEI